MVDTTEAYLHETCQGLFSLCRQTVQKVSCRSICGLPWVDVLSIPQARGCLWMKIDFHISISLLCSSFTAGGVRHDPQYVMGKNVVKMWRRSFPA